MKYNIFKKILLLFVVINISIIFTSCKKELSEMNERQLVNTFKTAYLEQYIKEIHPETKRTDITVSYNKINDLYLVYFEIKGSLTSDLHFTVYTEEYLYSFSNYYYVYKDGILYRMQDAYDNKVLSEEELYNLCLERQKRATAR